MSDPKYDVFLSFSGEDTRETFTNYLYNGLTEKHIKTFLDNYDLERGAEISQSLITAIEESKIYIVILSEHYASSRWCLDELTKILECKKEYEREVIPVFYKVDPSDVRHQRKSYAVDSLKHHEHRSKDKIDAWKAALTQVGNFSGLVSQNFRPESTLVTGIVKDILKKLDRCILSNYEGMTGIGTHIEKIQSSLQLESPTVRMIGIWGMGGIGKTTIASAVFEKLATQFRSRCNVLNVQQEIKRIGSEKVKQKYLSQLLGGKIKINEYDDSSIIVQKLKRTKVLLVFDDVKDFDQLNDLYGTHDNFAEGSRIIVTSRDKQVLENANADEIYQVKEMDYKDSLQLFHSFAFKHNRPIEETYVSLSDKVLDYAQGVPLALKVLGSLLYGRTKEAWESQLQKLKKLPDHKIFSLLKLSYDGLDSEQKNIFLDIACFHRGELVTAVEQTLDCCGFSTRIGLDVLKDRCLISISEYGEVSVQMHDLIQEMGHEIVRLECEDDPEKRSRLWKPDDIYKVFKKDRGKATDAIQCIFLDMEEMEKIQLHAKTFKKMRKLRIIQFVNFSIPFECLNVTFDASLESLPNALKILHWDNFLQRSLPQDVCPENLVILEMPFSDLEQLWEGDKVLPNLKRLNLRCSTMLIRVPDLSFSQKIEEVFLSGCVSLTHVYSSSFLNKLNWLCLDGCTKLERLDIHSNILWSSSGLVALRGCHNLQMLLISSRTDVLQSNSCPPCYYANSNTVRVFDDDLFIYYDYERGYQMLGGGSISVSDNRTSINEFCWLDVSDCKSLSCLPAELFNLKFLTRLCLNGCSFLEELPEIKETMKSLKVLMLDYTPIKELPSSLDRLVRLEELSLRGCTKLKTIPSSIGNLSKLLKLDLTYCESLETFPCSIFKLNLTELNFKGCSMLRTFPEIPNNIGRMSSLTELSLEGSMIVNLPESMADLSSLRLLNLSDCKLLECVPNNIGRLSSLTELSLQGSRIVNLPESMADLSSLRLLNLSDCKLLECVPNNIGRLSSLTELSLQGSRIVNLPESMADLSSLNSLNITDCKFLKCIPKLPPHLNKLLAIDHPSIKRFGGNSRLKLISDSKKGTFQFNLSNSQELDATSLSNSKENGDDGIEELSRDLLALDLSLGGNYTQNKRRKI